MQFGNRKFNKKVYYNFGHLLQFRLSVLNRNCNNRNCNKKFFFQFRLINLFQNDESIEIFLVNDHHFG